MGARLAIEELNAKGIRIGGRVARFELIASDDAADPRRGVQVADQFVGVGVHGVVGHLNSGTTIPASTIYNRAGLVQISPSAANPKYTQQGFSTTFRIIGDDAALGVFLGIFVASELRPRTIVVIDDRTAYGAGLADHFQLRVQMRGGSVAAREYTSDRATDFPAWSAGSGICGQTWSSMAAWIPWLGRCFAK